MSAVKSTLLKYSCHSMLVFFLALLGAALAAPVQKPATTTLILKMAKGLTLAQAQSVAKGHGGTPKGSIPKLDLHIIEVPTQAADNIIKAMKGDAQILRVESDHVRKWQGGATDNGASVILMAFSATGYSLALQDAIDYAWVHNVVLVAAAGNEASNTPTFPAGDRGVIGVSATDQNDILAPSSTIGGSVFLAAPGVDILGTYPNNSYVTWSG